MISRFLVLAFVLFLWASAEGLGAPKTPKAGKPPKPDSTDEIFTNGIISTIHVQISSTNMALLRKNSRAYVKATIKEGTNTWEEVGVHLKGSAGSVRQVDENPAMTLNFDKYVDRQKFHGLDKIHLNNSVQDPSFMTEMLCGEMFRASGVPAARVTHARVFLNGRDLGLYVVKEGFDKIFLRQHFKNTKGNLYDGGFLRDITEPLEIITGSEGTNRTELKALVAAANESEPLVRMEKLNRLLDMDEFLSLIAMEHMTYHWDGYLYKKNNYKVYHDPGTDKVYFLPHGMDQMFWSPPAAILPRAPATIPVEGMVARAVLLTSEGRKRFRERVGTLYTNVFNLQALTNRINEIQAHIRPALATIHPNKAKEHDGQVDRIRQLVTSSARQLEKLLQLPEPKPLQFDSQGVVMLANLPDWRPEQSANDQSLVDQVTMEDGKKAFHVIAGSDRKCTAAWRLGLLLEPGKYRFEAMMRTAGVEPLPPPPPPKADAPPPELKGDGAGIRISRPKDKKPRSNGAIRETSWQKAEYEFEVDAGNDEIKLICELRAVMGEAWFDVDSLRLVKLQ